MYMYIYIIIYIYIYIYVYIIFLHYSCFLFYHCHTAVSYKYFSFYTIWSLTLCWKHWYYVFLWRTSDSNRAETFIYRTPSHWTTRVSHVVKGSERHHDEPRMISWRIFCFLMLSRPPKGWQKEDRKRGKRSKNTQHSTESRNVSSDEIMIEDVYLKAPYTINTKNISEYSYIVWQNLMFCWNTMNFNKLAVTRKTQRYLIWPIAIHVSTQLIVRAPGTWLPDKTKDSALD